MTWSRSGSSVCLRALLGVSVRRPFGIGSGEVREVLQLVTALAALLGAIVALVTAVVQARAVRMSRGASRPAQVEAADAEKREDGPEPQA